MRFSVLVLLLVLGHCVFAQGSVQSCRKAAKSSLDECACFPGCTAMRDENGYGHHFVFTNSTRLSPSRKLLQDTDCRTNQVVYVSVGDNRINYGTVKPYDVVHHLYDICHERGCAETSPFSMDTNTLAENGRQTQSSTISVVGKGVYRNWDYRNGFVEYLATAAGENVADVLRTPGANCGTNPDCEPRSIRQFEQNDFYQAASWNDCGLQGYIQATITVSTNNKWSFLCQYAFQGIQAALEVVSAGAGAVLGALSVSCDPPSIS